MLAHAIESHDGTKEHPDRNIGFWRLSAIDVERRLKPARRVIGEITNGPATQRRQFRAPGQLLSVKEVAQELDRILVANFTLPLYFDRGLSAAAAHDHPGIRAQKRIASDSLTTLDRLQQKGVTLISGESQERAHRRLQIREDTAHYGHDVAAGGFAFKFFKGCWFQIKHLFPS